MRKSFSVAERLKSIGFACRGIVTFLKEEHNARIHLAATVFVFALTFIFPVSQLEIVALVLSIGFVWAAEIFNTAIEKTMDFISTKKDTRIKVIKDLAAAAVLVAAIIALITGCLIFIPKI